MDGRENDLTLFGLFVAFLGYFCLLDCNLLKETGWDIRVERSVY